MKHRQRQRIIRDHERSFAVVDGKCVYARWWWLSFADGELPEGTQFLGACVVKAPSEALAVTASHMLGINPGGGVAIVGPLTDQELPREMPTWRLMQREEIDAVDAMVAAREAIEERRGQR